MLDSDGNCAALLGMALENVSGLDYKTVMFQTMLSPLGMLDTGLSIPPSEEGRRVPSPETSSDMDQGYYNATGGFWSTSSDMSRLLRFLLDDPELTNRWLKPTSLGGDFGSFYGMPWEIFQSQSFLPGTNRTTSFYTKGGSLDSYYTQFFLVPEYQVGGIIFVAGEYEVTEYLREEVTSGMVPALDEIAEQQTHDKYAGRYSAVPPLNSSVTLKTDTSRGLYIDSWISNGTDFLNSIHYFTDREGCFSEHYYRVFPTGQSRGAGNNSEVWRWRDVPVKGTGNDPRKWDDFCFEDVGGAVYVGREVHDVEWKGHVILCSLMRHIHSFSTCDSGVATNSSRAFIRCSSRTLQNQGLGSGEYSCLCPESGREDTTRATQVGMPKRFPTPRKVRHVWEVISFPKRAGGGHLHRSVIRWRPCSAMPLLSVISRSGAELQLGLG